MIGHSYGGAVATNVGAEAVAAGLPKPASMLLVNPFVENAAYKPPVDAIDPDLSGIPKGTELDCIVADIDSLTGRLGCDEIFGRIDHVKRADYLWMYSDDHGDPPLTISHVAPIIAAADDAYDFYGFWKLSDALGTCALDDRNCAYATGGGAKQTQPRRVERRDSGPQDRRLLEAPALSRGQPDVRLLSGSRVQPFERRPGGRSSSSRRSCRPCRCCRRRRCSGPLPPSPDIESLPSLPSSVSLPSPPNSVVVAAAAVDHVLAAAPADRVVADVAEQQPVVGVGAGDPCRCRCSRPSS